MEASCFTLLLESFKNFVGLPQLCYFFSAVKYEWAAEAVRDDGNPCVRQEGSSAERPPSPCRRGKNAHCVQAV